jgi:hypothetical protein
MPVLKQISPEVVPVFPKENPWNTLPSASNKTAGCLVCVMGWLFSIAKKVHPG